MDIQKLIIKLRSESLYKGKATLEIMDLCMEAAEALERLNDFEKSQCAKLLQKIAQLEAERDAAVEDAALAKCLTCGHKKKYEAKGINCYPEESCDICDAWFWRGPARKG